MNSRATIKFVRKCQLNDMLQRHESRERERSRIFQLRREMARDYKDSDPEAALK